MPTTSKDLNTLDPRSFDEALAAIYDELNKASRALDEAYRNLHHAVGDKQKRGGWTLTNAEIKSTAATLLESEDLTVQGRERVERAVGNVRRVEGVHHEIAERVAERNAIFQERGGWARFFLVSNTNGHIHSSLYCSTCKPTTQFTWLPSVSDKSEVEAVAEFGARLCTACFPTAPVKWTNHWEKEAERKRDESCPGSGTMDWVEGSTRFGYAAGNGGTCSHCGQWATATASRKIRRHKPAA